MPKYLNKVTGQVQHVADGGELHRLMGASPHYKEVADEPRNPGGRKKASRAAADNSGNGKGPGAS